MAVKEGLVIDRLNDFVWDLQGGQSDSDYLNHWVVMRGTCLGMSTLRSISSVDFEVIGAESPCFIGYW